MATKTLLNRLFSAKCNYDSNGFCHSFEDLSENEVTKLLVRVAREIYGVNIVFFEKFRINEDTKTLFSWDYFRYGDKKKYLKFIEDTGIDDASLKSFFPIDRRYEESDNENNFENSYFACISGKDCIGYLLVPEHGTISRDVNKLFYVIHNLSHIIISGNLVKKHDYGYAQPDLFHYYDSSDRWGLVENDKENVLESLAMLYTYILGSFLGVFALDFSLEDLLNANYALEHNNFFAKWESDFVLTALKTFRALDLIDDNMLPNFAVSSKTLEQVRHEINLFLNE